VTSPKLIISGEQLSQPGNLKILLFRLAFYGVIGCDLASAMQTEASAQQFAAGAYHLQSSVRSSLTQYDYTYTVGLSDSGAAAQNVVGTVVSFSPNTLVLKGSVNFGMIPANTSITSTDTFTIRQDRRFGFDPASLNWSFTASNAISLSSSMFNFGQNFVGSPLVKTVTIVTNSGRGTVRLQPAISGDNSFTIAEQGCGESLAPGASCGVVVQFLPTVASTEGDHAVLSLGITTLAPGAPQSVDLSGESAALTPGQVAQTANQQVAQYTLTLPGTASWWVNFGPTTSYGRSTSVQTLSETGTSSLYVAGMLPNTTYHMQASITLNDGATAVDEDHTFTTGALPAGIPATLPTTTTPGMTPQPGIELIDTVFGVMPTTALATDLQGNVIWAYPFPDRAGPVALYPVRLLPNGHFLCLIAPAYPNLPTAGVLNVIREFDLAGNTVQELSITDLNTRLAANGFALTLSAFSHDIVVLPNGHYLVIANTIKPFTDLPGYPGTTQVAGDTVIDLDSSLQPRWVWNSFDHLDINRHPMQFPDWTHANSLAYSKDDGNFLISVRHQNWVLKIDYRDGAGTGDVLWHLGEGGDFTLQGATDPTDWFYAQHYANFTSANTTGIFSLTLFDNGDDREFPAGVICGPLPGQTPCLYSTAQELQVDENAKTATFLFHPILPTNLYSNFAGNNELLPNGNFEYNLAGAASGASVFEVTPGATIADTPQTVWQMALPGTFTYRVLRQPSLYPGVQW
jgi:arylsulfate sulfotransferase